MLAVVQATDEWLIAPLHHANFCFLWCMCVRACVFVRLFIINVVFVCWFVFIVSRCLSVAAILHCVCAWQIKSISQLFSQLALKNFIHWAESVDCTGRCGFTSNPSWTVSHTVCGWTLPSLFCMRHSTLLIVGIHCTSLFFHFLPRCMKCRRGLAMRILSVRLSVCQTRDSWQNGRKIGPDFYTIRKNIWPGFLRRRMVGGGPKM